MPTSFDTVIDLALSLIDDYKLVKLYNANVDKFIKYCDGLLYAAIPNFTRCNQSLEYDASLRQFNNTLTPLEISILADLWIIEWFAKETQDSRKINVLLQSSGSFKTHTAAQNLKEKYSYLNGLREKVEQKMTNYQLQDLANIDIQGIRGNYSG